MPELPDVDVYCERIAALAGDGPLRAVRVLNPFLLRSVEPPLSAAEGRPVVQVRRLGKRVVLSLEGDLHLVVHLMIAGRLQWKRSGGKPTRQTLAVFEFPAGDLHLTEAGKKRRASLHVVAGAEGLAEHDRGGHEVLAGDQAGFEAAILRERRTLKRALTDPRILAGIGNAYSDEILFHAKLSPLRRTDQLDADERARLYQTTVDVLTDYRARIRAEVGGGWPKKVTAFRADFAVHGRYGQPCPVCEAPVQRVRYGDREMNYCARCQSADRLLRDRGLSRLMRDDWPKTLDELAGR